VAQGLPGSWTPSPPSRSTFPNPRHARSPTSGDDACPPNGSFGRPSNPPSGRGRWSPAPLSSPSRSTTGSWTGHRCRVPAALDARPAEVPRQVPRVIQPEQNPQRTRSRQGRPARVFPSSATRRTGTRPSRQAPRTQRASPASGLSVTTDRPVRSRAGAESEATPGGSSRSNAPAHVSASTSTAATQPRVHAEAADVTDVGGAR
jgi:hypothetical protein